MVASAVAALVRGPARALAVAKLVGGAAHVASRVLSVVLWLLTLGEAKLSRSPLDARRGLGRAIVLAGQLPVCLELSG